MGLCLGYKKHIENIENLSQFKQETIIIKPVYLIRNSS